MSISYIGRFQPPKPTRQIFNDQVTKLKDSAECGEKQARDWFGCDASVCTEIDAIRFRMISEFVRSQLGVTSDFESNAKENMTDAIRICLVARTGKTRNFRNVSALKMALEERDPDDSVTPNVHVSVVDFDGMNLREQIEAMIKPSPTFIIMAHGAGQTNLWYLDEFTASNTTVIEISPPYTHCKCTDLDEFTAISPHFYYTRTQYMNMSYYAYAVEDERLSCQQYCDSNKHYKPESAARHKVRDMKYVTVSPQSLRSMVYDIMRLESPLPKDVNAGRIKVHRVHFGEDVLQKFANLRNANGPITVPDMN